ncbi:hypothetical protein CROQUDRAFT_90797 [Cronartium quercuum f. sp. fusiforme G11]|uniref:Cytochrome c oxidase assembly protein n=1 Tax=Cronartium quercuum f. sp. fusiforme G11 TaxID=708437 RepID=A0A9P6NPR1_9BASI|nr:hypothetical protein CROQUDRAFT_90797 [Cronartium quercuum f. sp. fusiforme G11]
MSRLAKLTFAGTSVLTGLTVWGVHLMQLSERDAMYQGVLRDDERVRKRREQMARDEELNEQRRRQVYLESLQPVSNPSGPPPQPRPTLSGDTNQNPIKFEGCKTC